MTKKLDFSLSLFDFLRQKSDNIIWIWSAIRDIFTIALQNGLYCKILSSKITVLFIQVLFTWINTNTTTIQYFYYDRRSLLEREVTAISILALQEWVLCAIRICNLQKIFMFISLHFLYYKCHHMDVKSQTKAVFLLTNRSLPDMLSRKHFYIHKLPFSFKNPKL